MYYKPDQLGVIMLVLGRRVYYLLELQLSASGIHVPGVGTKQQEPLYGAIQVRQGLGDPHLSYIHTVAVGHSGMLASKGSGLLNIRLKIYTLVEHLAHR